MEKDIYALAFELKDLLDKDSRIINLNAKEEAMKNSKDVLLLVNRKEEAVSLYENSLKANSQVNKEEQKRLHGCKLELDNHPLVRAYLDAYSEVRDLYFAMNDILFSGLSLHLKEHK